MASCVNVSFFFLRSEGPGAHNTAQKSDVGENSIPRLTIGGATRPRAVTNKPASQSHDSINLSLKDRHTVQNSSQASMMGKGRKESRKLEVPLYSVVLRRLALSSSRRADPILFERLDQGEIVTRSSP